LPNEPSKPKSLTGIHEVGIGLTRLASEPVMFTNLVDGELNISVALFQCSSQSVVKLRTLLGFEFAIHQIFEEAMTNLMLHQMLASVLGDQTSLKQDVKSVKCLVFFFVEDLQAAVKIQAATAHGEQLQHLNLLLLQPI
jgi:hypothetical protein